MLLNRVNASTSTVGTGAAALGAAASSYQTWAGAGAVDGQSYSYLLLDAAGAWELGRGVYSSGAGTLTRPGPGADASFHSSTGALLALSGAATIACVANVLDYAGAASGGGGTVLAALSWAGGAIASQVNVASVNVLSDGVYQINFTNALPNTNYAVSGSSKEAEYANEAAAVIAISRNTTLPAHGKSTGYVVICVRDTAGGFYPVDFDIVVQSTQAETSNPLAGVTALHLAADMAIGAAWTPVVGLAVDHDPLAAYPSDTGVVTVPAGVNYARVTAQLAWDNKGGNRLFAVAAPGGISASSYTLIGHMSAAPNEGLQAATGAIVAVTPGQTYNLYAFSLNGGDHLTGSGSGNFGGPSRFLIEWFSAYPGAAG